jgi:Winged helix-turn-helix domain (DUF2582)
MPKAAAAPVPTPAQPASCIHEIGETAGTIWQALNENGAMSIAKLVERIGGNRDVVMQAVGWLAREGKLEISETKRGKTLSLKEE